MATIREMFKSLGETDRKHFKRAIQKKFSLTEAQYFDRIVERIQWDIEQRANIMTWFEENGKGGFQLKMTEEFFDLAGIPYPVGV